MGADLFGGDFVRVQEMNRAATPRRQENSGASRRLECIGLPRRCAPRNDEVGGLPRRFVPRNDASLVIARRAGLRQSSSFHPARERR
jgi:hypothetical protein